MRRIARALLALVICAILLVAAAPYALYRLGLQGIEGRPEKPVQLATPAQQQWVWSQFSGPGEHQVQPLDPYSVAYALACGDVASLQTRGSSLASGVARDYLLDDRYRQRGWWHLYSASLAIWLTRNWSTEELLSKYWQERARKGMTPRLASAARD